MTLQNKIPNFIAVGLVSLLVHIVFCVQVFMGLPSAMGIGSPAMIIFFPHYILMFIFPPSYPIHDDGSVGYWALWGKLLVAFPASLAYAFIFVGICSLLGRLSHRK